MRFAISDKCFQQMLFPGSYTLDVAFVGRHVIGNVATLTVDTSACSTFGVLGGGDASVTVEHLDEGDAVGTATAVQRVKASDRLRPDENVSLY